MSNPYVFGNVHTYNMYILYILTYNALSILGGGSGGVIVIGWTNP
jgi:hypothetical protein